MPSSSRPRGSSAGGSQNYSRIPPVTPMSERQQMALLMQMTSNQSDTHSTTVNASSPSPGPSGVTSRTRERNERGETALHVAAIKGDLDQINKLLEQGHNPNVGDFAGWTPLHEACNHGWYTVAAALVKAGANVNARGLDDDTPLHDAATNGQMKLVRLLVEKGADPTFKNRKGKSACEVAAPAVYNYLLAAKAESTANQYVIHTGRAREEKKTEGKKPTSTEEAAMDPKPPASGPLEDVYDFKPGVKEGGTATLAPDKPTDANADTNSGETIPSQSKEEPAAGTKRNVSETSETNEDCDEDVKRKKRKDSDCVKETAAPKVNTVRTIPGKTGKTPGPASKTMMGPKLGSNVERKSPCASPKPTIKTDSDAEPDEKCGETGFSMKVPPLKIVIPQSGSEGDSGGNRNGKTSSQRTHVALPYVVASNSNDSDKDGLASSVGSPADSTKSDDKKSGNVNFSGALQDDRQQPRVLRSSYRGSCASSGSGQGSVDRGSNNSSPQLQASVPPSPPNHSPVVSEPAQASTSSAGQTTSTVTSQPAGSDSETPTNCTASPSSSNPPQQKEAPVELHPRKRKIKASKDAHTTATTSVATSSCSQQDNQEVKSDVHPHDQPITNCYQMFLNIRKQIERRQKSLFPVQPKPPQGFKDYLMNRCTYALAGNKTKEPVVTLPASLPTSLRDLFTQQEHQRYKLKMQHVVEKEKLVLAVEQEILRVHGRAARALANQALPFSVCTILKDQEVYNIITPEQEEKDRNARSRYNGRLFLSWLQDVDDKWEKIKEAMLLRHHNEAESLHAVQKMDWDWQLKELNLSDQQSSPVIEEGHVPMVHVSDDFDLLPA